MTSRHGSLRSVARAVVEDFTSMMNHVEGYPVMGHVARAARGTGATQLRVDLLGGDATPPALLVPPVRVAVASLADWFRELAGDTAQPQPAPGRDRDPSGHGTPRVRTAELIVTLDPATRRTNHLDGAEEIPFTCEARLTDARGAVHSWRVGDWW
jgi:hypothetical protein